MENRRGTPGRAAPRFITLAFIAAAAGCLPCANRCLAQNAPQFSTIYTFNAATGGPPTSPLAVGADGNLYGSTNNFIFSVTPDGSFTKIYANGGSNIG